MDERPWFWCSAGDPKRTHESVQQHEVGQEFEPAGAEPAGCGVFAGFAASCADLATRRRRHTLLERSFPIRRLHSTGMPNPASSPYFARRSFSRGRFAACAGRAARTQPREEGAQPCYQHPDHRHFRRGAGLHAGRCGNHAFIARGARRRFSVGSPTSCLPTPVQTEFHNCDMAVS